jgi:hypothetical protein
MPVGKNHSLKAVWADPQIPVFPVGLSARPLKRAAVNEETFSIYLNDVLRPGNFLSRAEGIEGDIHEARI